jgi:hypothetical protein
MGWMVWVEGLLAGLAGVGLVGFVPFFFASDRAFVLIVIGLYTANIPPCERERAKSNYYL